MVASQEDLGDRLRRAREQAGLTQTRAAEELGVSQAALNHYESGKRRVDALTLEQLGRAYRVPLRYFFGEEVARPDWEDALCRQAAEVSAAGRQGIGQLIARVLHLEELYERTGTPFPRRPYPPFDWLPEAPFAADDVASWAERTRRHFDLGIAPLPDLRGFLEAQGYLVFTVPLGKEEDDLSGLYFSHPDLGPVVVLNEDQAYSRRPFTMAHELGHSLFHYDRPAVLCRSRDQRPLEQFADRFASFFLVPREALRQRLRESGRRTVRDPEQVVHLARYFGVSYQAMRRRLADERRLEPTTPEGREVKPVALARALGYRPSPFEFGERPLPLEEQLPRVFLELARRVLQQEALSRLRVAEMLGVGLQELDELVRPQQVEALEEACA